jgi:hypothetical protein
MGKHADARALRMIYKPFLPYERKARNPQMVFDTYKKMVGLIFALILSTR